MAGFASRWRWVLFNLFALSVFLLVSTQGSTGWTNTEGTFDRMLESGKWGIRFLLLSLAMTPLHTYLRWSGVLKLRKPAGLWAFAFGMTHFLLYAYESWEPYPAYWVSGTPWHWLAWPMQLYVALGLIALCILTALAITSNKWSMRRLGKRWKQLHRLVYGAGVAITIHALLAATMSKKMAVRDPQVEPELRVYLGVVVILLVVRIPRVRGVLLKLVAVARPQVRPVERVAPIVLPSRTPPLRQWPMLDMPEKAPMFGDTPHTTDPLIEPRTAEPAQIREREPAV